jgi:hypothetical protein
MMIKRRSISYEIIPIKIWACVFILLFSSSDGKAQNDTAETIVADSPSTYEGKESRKKHIYDSSDRFFNWKEEVAEIYYARKPQKNPNSDAALSEIKKDKDFWYIAEMEKFQSQKGMYLKRADSLSRLRKPVPQDRMLENRDSFEKYPWLRTLLWCIIIGILVFALVYFLTVNKLSLFARKDTHSQTGEKDETSVDIFQTPFDEVLAKARAEKNFRLMTRVLYLQTLRLLSDKNIIRYSPNYTNLTYLDQLRSTDHYMDFFTITRHYEYVWYGKFELPEEAYGKIETAIRSFQKRFV